MRRHTMRLLGSALFALGLLLVFAQCKNQGSGQGEATGSQSTEAVQTQGGNNDGGAQGGAMKCSPGKCQAGKCGSGK